MPWGPNFSALTKFAQLFEKEVTPTKDNLICLKDPPVNQSRSQDLSLGF